MAIRTFWAILLKILGIYIILQMLAAIPGFVGSIYQESVMLRSTQSGVDMNEPFNNHDIDKLQLLLLFIYNIGLFLIYSLVVYNCLFKTDRVIDKLKLDTGFESEHLELNIHRSTLLKIVIMLTGATILITYIPPFFVNLSAYFKHIYANTNFTENPESPYLVLNLVKIFIGYFLLTCSRMIVNYIERKQRKRESSN